jgi:DNA-directed RNA polymerase subunit RPC12/RpoP
MTESESSSEEYVCEACGKSFETERALERHIHEVGLVD